MEQPIETGLETGLETPFFMLMVKEAIAKELMETWPGVTGIDVGLKKVGGELTDEFAIRVYVSDKRDDVPDEERIPPYIAGYQTDVLQINAKPIFDTSTYRPLRGGIFIGTHTGPGPGHGAGTAGCIVFDALDSTPYLLSNYHVLFAGAGVGDDVSQPPEDQGGTYPDHVIGKVKRGVINENCDAAVCTINTTYINDIINVGALPQFILGGPNGSGLLFPGNSVIRRGAASGPIRGTVDSITVTVNVPSASYPGGSQTFTNQISISPVGASDFNIPGDSGSIVMGVGGNGYSFPGGLAFAAAEGGVGFANHMWQVFTQLRVRTSTNQPPGTSFAKPILRGYTGNIVTERAFDSANKGRTSVLTGISGAESNSQGPFVQPDPQGIWTYYYVDPSDELRAVSVYVTGTSNDSIQNPDYTLNIHTAHFQNPEWVGIRVKSFLFAPDNGVLAINSLDSPRFHFFSGQYLTSRPRGDILPQFYGGSHVTDDALGDEEIAAISTLNGAACRIVAFRSPTQPASYRALPFAGQYYLTSALAANVVYGENNVGDTYNWHNESGHQQLAVYQNINLPRTAFYQERPALGSIDSTKDYLNIVAVTAGANTNNPTLGIQQSVPVEIGQSFSDYVQDDNTRSAATIAPTKFSFSDIQTTGPDEFTITMFFYHESIFYVAEAIGTISNPNGPLTINVRTVNDHLRIKTGNNIKFIDADVLHHYFQVHSTYYAPYTNYVGAGYFYGFGLAPPPTGVFWVDTNSDTAYFTNIENADNLQVAPVLTLPGSGSGFSGLGTCTTGATKVHFELNVGWFYENSLMVALRHNDGGTSFVIVTLREVPLGPTVQPALRLTQRTDDSNTGGSPRLHSFMSTKQESNRIEGSYW